MAEIKQEFISANDYRQKYGQKIKVLELPSGAIFKIRKLQVLDFLSQVIIPTGLIGKEDLEGWEEKSQAQRIEVLDKNKTKKTDNDLMVNMIINSVVSPKLVQGDVPAESEVLSLSELDPLDYAVLLQEVVKFNRMDAEFSDRVKPFCPK